MTFFLLLVKTLDMNKVLWYSVSLRKGLKIMPKLIESYEEAVCKSIRRISDMPYKIWNWREECVALAVGKLREDGLFLGRGRILTDYPHATVAVADDIMVG